MNDYMRALHQRFYREPDFSELEEDIEDTRREVRDCLASFTAGFKLAWGLSKELEADGLYSFDEEETERLCHRIEQED